MSVNTQLAPTADVGPQPVRVMVVDDSAVIRGLISKALEADPAIKVMHSASNGQMAVDIVQRSNVEVVVLDVEMPVMDGLTALPKLLAAKPGLQVVMASTLTRRNADISLQALAAGAADYVAKPSSSELVSAEAFKRELTAKVKALGQAYRRKHPDSATAAPTLVRRSVAPAAPAGPPAPIKLRAEATLQPEILAIGSSTGGPQALFKVLGGLGGKAELPILVTQHMPATFTAILAEHIAQASKIPTAEARDGEPVLRGRIYVAPGDIHMTVAIEDGRKVIRLVKSAPENFCRPAVDPMLRSVAAAYGARTMVLILTGMGSDGQKGSATVVAAGGTVVAQDEASSVVWGMPGAVAKAGLCSAVLPLPEIAPYLRRLAMRSAA
ncbi:MAG TPA: chemotaxis response regulator protein-glutamate methylesterase [Hypericibacter adhaerens]|jgi:two-component system chemotaxis response regulator CheB|uniref:Protein-glutamate methylesterase/protein-glutamine glutaminase n=1 Tax=Hypericibacter adhaerens TaxID=2602016 RepID=A0A5J6N3R1_9PROT|nr:chemotaxis response regulator protein-glutamate methylesterase [Hypericibacter adhaerens]QEX23585.1 chemotaxis response regulator protein-glutamate methylesterase 1 [Hypericibacter adhaerens]HWA41679.1 chemotaxis response regulator protein-glutamate methylesterase [Hypericibacter adhaerens]